MPYALFADLVPLVYPSALTHETQVLLGLAVLFINAVIYALVLVKEPI